MMKSDNRKAAKAVFCIIKNPWKEVGRLAKKLKNLEVTKVDFVDEGANQGANIKLFKRKDQNDNPVVAVPVQDPRKLIVSRNHLLTGTYRKEIRRPLEIK